MNTTPPIDSSLPTENPQQSETPRQHVGRESSSYWTVHAIDLGAIKKIKVKVREVNNLPRGERIIVEFDEVGMAIGQGQCVLAGYCGTLATNGNLFPINFERWSGKTGMPNTYFLECFKEILQLLETGQLPSRGKLYIETHKRKDRSFVNDAEKAIAEQIEVGLTQSTTNESGVSPNDVVGRVLGPEHSGRVRCMGLGADPTNSFRNTRLRLSDLSLASSSTATSSSCSNQWQQEYTNLESQVQTTLGALKAYMIMKEGKIPHELAVFFDPQPQQTGDADEPESPLGTRGSSGASNI
ncbi:putative transposase, Ptta/En/Spm, plant [Sesbania bispinosa]|nr:putative transposase, Ptta/En/Spm, plant [Sesbania bispinosa]